MKTLNEIEGLVEAKQYAEHLMGRSDNDRGDTHTITLYKALTQLAALREGFDKLLPLVHEFMDPERHLDRNETINISIEVRQGFQDFLQANGYWPLPAQTTEKPDDE